MKEKNKFIGWSLLDEAKKRRCLQRPCSCGRSLIFEAPKAKPDDLITEGEYPWWINPVLRGKDSISSQDGWKKKRNRFNNTSINELKP